MVQTAVCHAGFGRYGGADLSLIAERRGGDFHGTFFEFLRNELLNANHFLLNQTCQPRQNF